MTDAENLNEIEQIRAINNMLWMKIIAVALKHAPAETKSLLHDINHNDESISLILKEIAKS